MSGRSKTLHTCTICSKGFYPWSNTTGLYCSRRCAWEGRGGAEFNARVARATVAARADRQRGRGEGKAYRKLNGRHEHRVVAEMKLGRPLEPGEVVHHIDGDFLNNHPDNLAVMTREHMRLHGLGIPGMKLTWEPWKARRRAA